MIFPASIQKQLVCILLLVLSSTGIYFNSLKGSFQFDDVPLLSSPWIENLDSFNRFVKISAFENRPILLWTYALNNTLGKNKEFGFHLFNLFLHTGVTLLVFFSVLKTSSFVRYRYKPGIKLRGAKNTTSIMLFPLITALIFSLHPLNTDSVTYISSRSSVLATFFYLLSLYLFLNIFCLSKNNHLLSKRLIFISLVAASMYLSIASKLISATLPLLLGFWYFVFVFPKNNPKTTWNKYWIYLLFVLLSTAVLFLSGKPWLYIAKDQGMELYGRIPYLLIQTKVIIFYYLKLFLFPFNLNVDSGMPFSTIWEDPFISLAILIILGILITSIRLKNVWLLVGTTWFFITLGPTSSFVPLNDIAVEHRTYLPMTLGLCLIIGWGISCLSPNKRLFFLTAMLITFSLVTISRNGDWISETSLWEDVARKNPNSSRAHNNLGKAYFEKGDLVRAGYHFKKSIENIPKFTKEKFNIKRANEFLSRNNRSKNFISTKSHLHIVAELVEPHYNLASIYIDQGKLDLAEKEYLQTLSLSPNHSSAKIGLGSVYNKKGLFDKAEELYRQAIEDGNSKKNGKPYPIAHLNLGEVYGKTGRISLAIKEWERAINLDGSLLPAHFNLGAALMMQGKLERAEKYFLNCLYLNKNFEPALFKLALLEQKKLRWKDSINRFKAYMEITGASPSVLTQIGFNYLNLNDRNNAVAFFERSLKMLPTDINTLILLGDTFLAQGNPKKAGVKYREAINLNKDHRLKKILQAKIKNIPTSNN